MAANNEKKATLSDVAKHAGVSTSLVSRYVRGLSVSPKRAKLIQYSIEQLGYVHNVMAGNLSSASSNVVGVIVPFIDDEFYAEILQYIQDYIRDKGFWLQIGCSGHDPDAEEEAIKSILGWNPQYIAVVGGKHTNNVKNIIRNGTTKFIQMTDILDGTADIRIGLDHKKIGFLAAEHLYHSGCKRLAYVGMNLSNDRAAGKRAEGFQAAALAQGDNKPLIIDHPYSINTFNKAAESLLDILANEPDIDGICTSDDNLAVGILIEARNRNIAVPERMSVLGFGNSRVGYVASPSLSTIDPYASMMATEVAKALTGQINNFPGEEIMETGYRIIPRNSSQIK